MKFQKGDKVVIKSDTKSSLGGSLEIFFGFVGIVEVLPTEINSGKHYGINFGRKIFETLFNGDRICVTHHLAGRLKSPYGQFVHEDDLEFFDVENVFPEAQEGDESGVEDLI